MSIGPFPTFPVTSASWIFMFSESISAEAMTAPSADPPRISIRPSPDAVMSHFAGILSNKAPFTITMASSAAGLAVMLPGVDE